jgi:hypothetical protein
MTIEQLRVRYPGVPDRLLQAKAAFGALPLAAQEAMRASHRTMVTPPTWEQVQDQQDQRMWPSGNSSD